VRRELVERQAIAVGVALWSVPLPWPCSNEQYESLMAQACDRALAAGVEGIAFGDLFLEDVRAYREKQMKDTGLEPVFPVWGLPTAALAREMIVSGVRAKLTCVDTDKLDRLFVGREFDVYAGPMFRDALPVTVGERVARDQFVFADLISE